MPLLDGQDDFWPFASLGLKCLSNKMQGNSLAKTHSESPLLFWVDAGVRMCKELFWKLP